MILGTTVTTQHGYFVSNGVQIRARKGGTVPQVGVGVRKFSTLDVTVGYPGSRCTFTFCVSRRRRKMYCGYARLFVCLSAAVRSHYCTDPDITWGHSRGCPLVVHYWADLQSGHGLRCYGNIARTLVTSLRPSRDMTT